MTDFLTGLFDALSPLWEMSLTAAYAAAVVALLRLALKKRAPRQVLCLLWLVVFARLLVPVSLESPISIVPNSLPGQEQVQRVPQTPDSTLGTPNSPVQSLTPAQQGGVTLNPVSQTGPTLAVPNGVAPAVTRPESEPGFPWQALLAGVWLAGAAVMGGYGLISYLRLRHRLFDAIRAQDGAWEHPAVASPFILGMIRPRIYLPAGLYGQPRQFILCHERAHLRRFDHIVKPVCWVALALHWFNPLVWLAFLLMSRDIETACDEAVVRRLGSQVKADYSATLLSLATARRMPAPCPLAFDEGDARGRIQNVLSYRRPALWVIVVSAVAAVLAAVCLLTDPVAAQGPEGDPDPSASQSPGNPADSPLDPWMKEVLDGERTFRDAYREYNYGDTLDYTIHQLRTMVYGDEELPRVTVEVGKLAVIDLDRDGINEMVVWPTGESSDPTEIGYYTGYFIFRRQGDMAYVYFPGWRSVSYLKADGTFEWSGSAFEWGSGRARFDADEDGGFTVEPITWCDNSVQSEHYYVDGRAADRDGFDAAMAAQDAKPEPAWYTYANGALAHCLELLDQTDPTSNTGEAKLWLEDGKTLWLEWNGATTRLGGLIDPEQFGYILCRDFDGDGQDEVVLTWYINGFARLDLYEWVDGAPVLADSYDTQQLLVRFNQNNVAAYNKDTRGLTVTYSHTEGNMDDPDYYRHLVTGSCTLPENFFNGFEHIRDSYTHAYAYDFRWLYPNTLDNGTTEFYADITFCLADEAMKELDYVDIPPETESSPFSKYYADHHYMADRFVGTAPFSLRYDGTGWRVHEGDKLVMNFPDEPSAAPGPEPTPSPAPKACKHGLENIRLDYAGEQLVAYCDRCGFAYPIPGVTSANWEGMTGSSDGGGWMKEDLDGDGRMEIVVYTLDDRIVSLKMVKGAPVASSFDLKTLVDDFNQNSTYRIDLENRIMEVTYQGRTQQARLLDDSFWSDLPDDGSDLEPMIGIGNHDYDSWVNRLMFDFGVYTTRGDDLHIGAFGYLSYTASGRLQLEQFWAVV